MSPDKPGRIHPTYCIKTFGATSADVRFNRLPTVIQKAKAAISCADIDGFLMCALEKPPLMTGLEEMGTDLFFARRIGMVCPYLVLLNKSVPFVPLSLCPVPFVPLSGPLCLK